MPRESCQSRLLANDKGDNEMILGTVYDFLAFTLRLRKPWKTSARRSSDEGFATSDHHKWDRLTPDDVGRIVQHVKKGEGRKNEMDGEDLLEPSVSRPSAVLQYVRSPLSVVVG